MFQSLAKRFVKGYPQTDDPAVQQRLIFFSSVLGIVLNILLVGIKILIGTWVGSLAVISDGINNLMDSAGAVVAALGSYLSARPKMRSIRSDTAATNIWRALSSPFLLCMSGWNCSDGALR